MNDQNFKEKWTKQEAIERFDRACWMYANNDRSFLPEFEKEYAKNVGLNDEEINSIVNKYFK